MQINKHGTFYIRNGWPTKIVDTVTNSPHIFSPAFERDAVDEMGVGRVMVKAMRYWAYATGITEEIKEPQGVQHRLTELGNFVADFDLYCQKIGTLWLMHRSLATDLNNTTAWAWAFNLFGHKSFTKDDFVDAFLLTLFSLMQKQMVKPSSGQRLKRSSTVLKTPMSATKALI